jgi:hypothetical protein
MMRIIGGRTHRTFCRQQLCPRPNTANALKLWHPHFVRCIICEMGRRRRIQTVLCHQERIGWYYESPQK